MADAYKLKADASFPKAIRKVASLIDGQEVYETTGVNYVAGTYLYEADLTPRDRERASNGELDHLLDAASVQEADAFYALGDKGVFIPEHEAERVVLTEYGHLAVPRDQVLELKSLGADEAREVQEVALEDGASERPNITEPNYPSLADVSKGDANNVPDESEHLSEEKLSGLSSASRGLEQPPGLLVGQDKAQAEADENAPKKRGRPAKKEAAKPAADKEDSK